MAPVKTAPKSKRPSRYVIVVSAPALDKIFDVAAFEKFLHDRIKVQGRTNNLGESVTIIRDGDYAVIVEVSIDFSKRYLKYLTKKFLKKNNLRDWLRVVSTTKDTYELKYFNISNQEEEQESEDEE
ncbi:60S ribosomal protein L22 [Coemansia erecta]|uniref:60S ribosomal protein L22 n=1 Tax=Coemansia asiatica TaxID=1052880 RepID=A0A9W7XQF5_9FUNG|nr:60S ribosomal protein L22 [Coemansia asiatica]KAJ2857400.1 60S ribosomal protein L22 [Coemansia erecta]KAJ2879767.1 60S ribosomal protein L22 [Coemansia asiatica]